MWGFHIHHKFLFVFQNKFNIDALFRQGCNHDWNRFYILDVLLVIPVPVFI